MSVMNCWEEHNLTWTLVLLDWQRLSLDRPWSTQSASQCSQPPSLAPSPLHLPPMSAVYQHTVGKQFKNKEKEEETKMRMFEKLFCFKQEPEHQSNLSSCTTDPFSCDLQLDNNFVEEPLWRMPNWSALLHHCCPKRD